MRFLPKDTLSNMSLDSWMKAMKASVEQWTLTEETMEEGGMLQKFVNYLTYSAPLHLFNCCH